MTRINCGIKPEELNNKHLFAEIREIKRIPNCIKKGRYNLDGIPDKFKLGTGHVKFFYDKLLYLHTRYYFLVTEWEARGFKVSDYNEAFESLPKELYNHYFPTDRDRKILIKRLQEKDPIFYKNLV